MTKRESTVFFFGFCICSFSGHSQTVDSLFAPVLGVGVGRGQSDARKKDTREREGKERNDKNEKNRTKEKT